MRGAPARKRLRLSAQDEFAEAYVLLTNMPKSAFYDCDAFIKKSYDKLWIKVCVSERLTRPGD